MGTSGIVEMPLWEEADKIALRRRQLTEDLQTLMNMPPSKEVDDKIKIKKWHLAEVEKKDAEIARKLNPQGNIYVEKTAIKKVVHAPGCPQGDWEDIGVICVNRVTGQRVAKNIDGTVMFLPCENGFIDRGLVCTRGDESYPKIQY